MSNPCRECGRHDIRLETPREVKAVVKLWTCTDHNTYWPVGGASIVIAATEDEARAMLNAALLEKGLEDKAGEKPFTLTEVELDQHGCVILDDGQY